MNKENSQQQGPSIYSDEFKGTKGFWITRRNKRGDDEYTAVYSLPVDGSTNHINVMCSLYDHSYSDEYYSHPKEAQENNARLISAAPELLGALVVVRDLFDKYSDLEDSLSDDVKGLIRSAIEKAID